MLQEEEGEAGLRGPGAGGGRQEVHQVEYQVVVDFFLPFFFCFKLFKHKLARLAAALANKPFFL